MSKRETQADRLLALLSSYWYEKNGVRQYAGVPLPQILHLGIAQYHARIFELRRRGYDIRCEKETVDGQVRSKYRLVK